MDKIFKAFQIAAESLKAADKGKVTACFATMNVVDKDGDVTLPGFFGEQDVVIVPTHDWTHVPLGKGRTREEGDKAIVEIEMNLDIAAARDWMSALKFDLEHGKALQEWSYGFKVLEGGSRRGEHQGKQVRFLTPREGGIPGAKIWEVSPVLVGAGEGTTTLSAKGAEGQKFCDEAQGVLDAAEALVGRGKSLADLRKKEGRDLSAANRERLAALADSLTKVAKDLVVLVAPIAPSAGELEAKKELVRMTKIRAGMAA